MTCTHIQTTSSNFGGCAASFWTNNPRELRLLEALSQCSGLKREQLDRAIGASNSPDVVFRLRKDGWELPCERVNVIDRDGIVRKAGFYRFSDADRSRYESVGIKDEVHDVVN